MPNLSSKVQRGVSKFSSYKGVESLKNGMILSMPITLVGSIFLLLQSIPINGYYDFMAGIFGDNWQAPLAQVSGATFDITALVIVMGIAYSYAKLSKINPISCAILALVCFLIIIPNNVTTYIEMDNGQVITQTIGSVIPKVWAGGQGIIGAIIVGLFTGYIYVICDKKGLKIKMPDSVPEGVTNAFAALIPGFILMTLSAAVYALFTVFTGETLIEFIFIALQIPMQNLSDTFIASIIISFLVPFFWFFGIHGSILVGGIIDPISRANALENQALLDQGYQLIAGENARIVTVQMVEWGRITGAGITIGIVIAAILFAKSAQYKALGKLSIGPALFNINEPVIFGFPIVLNPLIVVPFIIVPVISNIILYLAIASGFIEPFGAVMVPWTTPPIVSGFILAGWRGAAVQILILIISICTYYPFFLKLDKIAHEKEQNQSEDDDDEDW